VSRARHALALLKRHTYRRLILNGDVFDDLNFKRLKADDWKFLSYVRKMSNPKTGVEVIWVIGNHDGGVADVLSHLLGVPVHEEYVFEVAGRIHVAIHGHQFDMWVTNRVVVTAVATALYTMLQVVDRKHRVSRWVKRTSKRILRMGDKIGHAATRHAKQHHNADVVHCGHTHIATEAEINGVRYVNSGSWTDAPSQYVTVEQDGTVILHHCS
jgi:predicted phosphodiesterase